MRATPKPTAHSQARIDATLRNEAVYLGPLCKNGHDDGGGSIRDVEKNLCQTCLRARMKKQKEQGI